MINEQTELTDSNREDMITYLENRDGTNCSLCGKELDLDDIHIDHKVPKAKGGSEQARNLQLAHPSCNISKSDNYP